MATGVRVSTDRSHGECTRESQPLDHKRSSRSCIHSQSILFEPQKPIYRRGTPHPGSLLMSRKRGLPTWRQTGSDPHSFWLRISLERERKQE